MSAVADRGWVTSAELADYLSIRPKTLRHYYQQGKLPADIVTKIGGQLRFDFDAAVKFLTAK
jgi:hypothetical protein